MFLYILGLAAVASVGNFPCEEPNTDYRLPSECPPGQVLHGNYCRSYFQLRYEEKTCLLSKDLFLTPRVPPDEIICPLEEKTSDCRLYRAYTANCFAFGFPSEQQPYCEQYDAQGESENLELCAELTDGLPLRGFVYQSGMSHVHLISVIVTSSHSNQCPTGYCPSDNDMCILWWTNNNMSEAGAIQGTFQTRESLTEFNHGETGNVTNVENYREHLLNLQKVPA